MNRVNRRNRSIRSKRRSAVVVLELILSLPILFIALLAIVEFGTILANLQIVALASRDGARRAAVTSPLNAGALTTIKNEIDARLQSAGFGASASEGAFLVHTVGGSATKLNTGICTDPGSAMLPSESVRLRVCVKLTKLGPNLLKPFGFNIAALKAENDATFDYEF